MNSNPKNNNAIAVVIPQKKHGITPNQLNKNAIKVLETLVHNGFEAYVVGGCVRDLLLNKHPKDFDIVTNAYPNQIKKIFRNCRLIGRRFRLAHIYFGREIIEVATFRAGHEGAARHWGNSHEGMVILDNVYGSIDQDAWRRDFTVNALYYNIQDSTILDFANGFEDLLQKKLRILGDPEIRYREDPVRMLRAARIAGKLGLTVTPETKNAIFKLKDLILNVPTARLHDEVIKAMQTGHACKIYPLLNQYGLFDLLFPSIAQYKKSRQEWFNQYISHLLQNTDLRVKQKKTVAPLFLFAALLWPPLIKTWKKYQTKKLSPMQAFELAAKKVLTDQNQYTALSKRLMATIKDVWSLQHRLEQKHPRYIRYIAKNPKFRAAYDLLLLRSKVDDYLKSDANWWTKFQAMSPKDQDNVIAVISNMRGKKG